MGFNIHMYTPSYSSNNLSWLSTCSIPLENLVSTFSMLHAKEWEGTENQNHVCDVNVCLRKTSVSYLPTHNMYMHVHCRHCIHCCCVICGTRHSHDSYIPPGPGPWGRGQGITRALESTYMYTPRAHATFVPSE